MKSSTPTESGHDHAPQETAGVPSPVVRPPILSRAHHAPQPEAKSAQCGHSHPPLQLRGPRPQDQAQAQAQARPHLLVMSNDVLSLMYRFLDLSDMIAAGSVLKHKRRGRVWVPALHVRDPRQLYVPALQPFDAREVVLYALLPLPATISFPNVTLPDVQLMVDVQPDWMRRLWPVLCSLPSLQRVRLVCPQDAPLPGWLREAGIITPPGTEDTELSSADVGMPLYSDDHPMNIMVAGLASVIEAGAVPSRLSLLNIDLLYRCPKYETRQCTGKLTNASNRCHCAQMCQLMSSHQLATYALLQRDGGETWYELDRKRVVLCVPPIKMLQRALSPASNNRGDAPLQPGDVSYLKRVLQRWSQEDTYQRALSQTERETFWQSTP